jgi:glucose/arabinose dehydrogenase
MSSIQRRLASDGGQSVADQPHSTSDGRRAGTPSDYRYRACVAAIMGLLLTTSFALAQTPAAEQAQASAAAAAAATESPASGNDCCVRGGVWRTDTFRPMPAFAQQTDAPPPAVSTKLDVAVLAGGLDHPWSLAFLPDGRMLVSERAGRLRIIGGDGSVSRPILGLPPIKVIATDGLLDVILDKDFAKNRTIYFLYFAPLGDGKLTGSILEFQRWTSLPAGQHEANALGHRLLARARLSNDGTRLEDVTPIFEGGNRRIVQAADGNLFLTADTPASLFKSISDEAQYLDNLYGKVLRIRTDGSIPADNPWYGKAPARPEIYSYGHKDPEGAAINPKTGDLWLSEHGPRGGDELNIVKPGRNYGFPVISYGRNYTGTPVNDGSTAKPGLEQPVYFWSRAVAPSGLLFYTGNLFPQWRNSVFLGGMVAKALIRLEIDGDRVVAEERLLTDRCKRIRDVRQGPDGALYILTDEPDGEVWRVTPQLE